MKINFYIPFSFWQPLQDAECKWGKDRSGISAQEFLEDSSTPFMGTDSWPFIYVELM